jgi:hypothetical protein
MITLTYLSLDSIWSFVRPYFTNHVPEPDPTQPDPNPKCLLVYFIALLPSGKFNGNFESFANGFWEEI